MNITIKFSTDSGKTEIVRGQLESFLIEKRINEHTSLKFRKQIKSKQKDDFYEIQNTKADIEVIYQEFSPFTKDVIFKGLVVNLIVTDIDRKVCIDVEAASYTYLMDIDCRYRFFQDSKLLYTDMINEIIERYDQAVANIHLNFTNKSIEQYLIQYEETDWQYLKRIASRSNEGVVADSLSSSPKFWFGIPDEHVIKVLDDETYHFFSAQKDLFKYRDYTANHIKKEENKSIVESDFVYLELKTKSLLNIGDVIEFKNNGIKLYVQQATALLDKQQLIFKCVLTSQNGLKQRKLFNRPLAGISLGAYVIQTGGPNDDPIKDKVKVSLDVVPFNGPIEKATWFSYLPLYTAGGNSGLYCLPEVGDYVYLKFPTYQEEGAFVTDSVRLSINEKSGEFERFKNTNDKYFRTPFEKEIAFKEKEVAISGKSKDLNARFSEEFGAAVSSHNRISIKSVGNISMYSKKNVTITAKKTMTLKCNPNTIELNGSMSQGGKIAGGVLAFKTGKVYKDYIGATGGSTDDNHGNDTCNCGRHLDFLNELGAFPEDYKDGLNKLHKKYHKWHFIAKETNLVWDTFIKKEQQIDKYGNSKSLIFTINKANPYKDRWVVPNSKKQNGAYPTTYDVIAYYADPRNFMDERSIFYFYKLTYDPKIHTREGVKAILKGTFMDNNEYVSYFMKAAKSSKVSPYVLASKSVHEMGVKGCTLAFGKVPGYPNCYNYYNWGATEKKINGKRVTADVAGAMEAKRHGWFTVETAIINGADFISSGYINNKQETLYEQKFDLKKFKHQYVQNVPAAVEEGQKSYDGLKKIGVLDNELVFQIPYFRNMPSKPCPKPPR